MVLAPRSARASHLHWNLRVSEFLRSHPIALPVSRNWRAARQTIWSLTPQVLATLAATLVVFDTFNEQGHRLLDRHILDAAFMLLVTTAILGPILTERYVPRTVSDLAERSEDALSAERMPVKESSP